MKDKTAKKLKQKRRSVRQVIKNAEEERILKNFDEIAKKRGIKKFNRKKALQSYKIVENEVTTEGVVNLVVVGAWYLRIKCKWGQKRVCQYIEGVIRYIGVVYNRERDIDKLAEELKDECDFDYEKLMNDFDPLKIKTSTAEQDHIKMVTCAMKNNAPIILYTFYSMLKWKKKRITELGQAIKDVLMGMQDGKLKEVKDVVRKECGMTFYYDGRIEYLDRRN